MGYAMGWGGIRAYPLPEAPMLNSGLAKAGCTAFLLLALVPARPAVGQGAGIPVGTRAPIVSVHDLDGTSVNLGQWIGMEESEE
jgi:hypothetical protein